MTRDAERADVVERRVAAFDDREDVIRLPPAFSPPRDRSAVDHLADPFHPCREGEAHHAPPQLLSVDAAERADAAIALEHALTQVRGAGSEAPLMNARVGTEGPPPSGDLNAAPAAEPTPVRTHPHRFHSRSLRHDRQASTPSSTFFRWNASDSRLIRRSTERTLTRGESFNCTGAKLRIARSPDATRES